MSLNYIHAQYQTLRICSDLVLFVQNFSQSVALIGYIATMTTKYFGHPCHMGLTVVFYS